MDYITQFSKIQILACLAKDRLNFALNNCYMEQALRIQVEEIEKEIHNILDILDGKEPKNSKVNKKQRKVKENKKCKGNL